MNHFQSRLSVLRGAGVLALSLTLLSGAAVGASASASAPAAQLAKLCDTCAIVNAVKSETRKGSGGAVGVVGGAVLGGVLGHQIGGGTGKTLATIGGAAAGGYAGNEVQKNVNKTTVWTTQVTLKDGSQRNFETSNAPGLKAGDIVRIEGNKLTRQ